MFLFTPKMSIAAARGVELAVTSAFDSVSKTDLEEC